MYVIKNGFLYESSSKIKFIRKDDKTHKIMTRPNIRRPKVHLLLKDV